jgi:alcohol dehydrogenase class IV
MPFEFATAGRIIFGPGVSAGLPAIAAAFGQRGLIVTGAHPGRFAALFAALESAGIACVFFAVEKEPTIALARAGADLFRSSASHFVLAIGGGSAIDAGKAIAIAAAAANPCDLTDYLEVIGKGRPLDCAPHPFIAVPTTAGTGSEVTRNAVLGSPADGVKVSLRDPRMLPRVAVVDPQLTAGLPRAITASTGLDALTQLIEPYVCSRANPMTDALCLDGLRSAASSLPRAFADPDDTEARNGMSYASLLGGLALANAGLGVVHGFAAPVGGLFDAPHGAICAALLAGGMRQNIAALRARAPQSHGLVRYAEIARVLTNEPSATPEHGVDWVRDLVQRLEIPPLRAYGIRAEHIPDLVEKAARASSMKANPIPLTPEELTGVMQAAL